MAAGGRNIPSAAGRGITRAAEAIFGAIQAEKDRALQRRRLDIDERIASVNRFTTLTNFLPPGAKLGDLGESGMQLFSDAFDLPAEGMEDLDLNPETISTVLDARARELFDTEEGKSLGLPAVRNLLGLEPNEAIADLETLQAQMTSQALTEITSDPGLMGEFVSRTLGRDPIQLRIPGVPGEISFDSPTAANIYSQFLLARERFSLELDLKKGEGLDKFVTEIQTAVSGAGQNVSSSALSGRIFPLYNQAVQSGETEGISAFLNDPNVTQGEKLALQFMLGSIGAGENVVLNELPPALRNFLVLGQTIRDILGPEAAAEVLPSITEALDPTQFGVFRNPFFRKLQFEIPGAVSPDQPSDALGGIRLPEPIEGQPSAANVPEPIRLQAAIGVLAEGSMTREDLVKTVGEDIVLQAEEAAPPAEVITGPAGELTPPGGIEPSSLSPALKNDATRLNRLIIVREGVSGELARQAMTNVIDRLRESINQRVRNPGG